MNVTHPVIVHKYTESVIIGFSLSPIDGPSLSFALGGRRVRIVRFAMAKQPSSMYALARTAPGNPVRGSLNKLLWKFQA